MPKVYIIILNYNNWQDTIECLESIYKLEYKNYQVVVVDNHSTDNSVEFLKKWAAGEVMAAVEDINSKLSEFVYPPVNKPIIIQAYTSAELEGNIEPAASDLILVQNSSNKGFAAGNNAGIRYAMKMRDMEYVWLINNDTVVEPDALTYQVKAYQDLRNKQVKVGLMGCKVLYYHHPTLLQCAGGARYNPWTGYVEQAYNNQEDQKLNADALIKLDYISGASMFFDRLFVEEVGYMDERYFLYYEELDWAIRSSRLGYIQHYVPGARIYHKEGGTITKKAGGGKEKSRISDFYLIRSRILFTKKFYPQCLPSIYLSIGYSIFNRVRRRQADRIPMLLRLMFNSDLHYREADR
jgi:GT2 family glycosyltransferase